MEAAQSSKVSVSNHHTAYYNHPENHDKPHTSQQRKFGSPVLCMIISS